jgi:hypothetical protein
MQIEVEALEREGRGVVINSAGTGLPRHTQLRLLGDHCPTSGSELPVNTNPELPIGRGTTTGLIATASCLTTSTNCMCTLFRGVY